MLVFGALVLQGARARAQAAPETGNELDLRYHAPSECPRRDVLLSAIRERAPRGWSAADDRSFDVRIERVAGGYRGRLDVERKGTRLSTREIGGPTCDVVSTALAVFVAIALDPAERQREEEAPPSSAVVETPPVVEAPPTSRRPAPLPVTAPAVGGGPRQHWYWGSGVSANAIFNPSSAWGARVHAEVARLGPGTRLAPELRVSWGFAELVDRPPHGGVATVRFETFRPEACALIERVPLTVGACAGLDLGWLRATTRDLPRAGGPPPPGTPRAQPYGRAGSCSTGSRSRRRWAFFFRSHAPASSSPNQSVPFIAYRRWPSRRA
ncbi:hypothetical protein AKJ09_01515 [Labilithrix luteola]|uniref:Uncharacterized protein n=1 Tax=Labilithrix luteola TaxID=1391654 RepID=A0A0K1PN83_9BACT|nr:hypothetical protein AKJ09_01515 [Labilithrix luteola]